MAYAEILFLRIWNNDNRNGHRTIAFTPAERLFNPQDEPFSLELLIVTILPLAPKLNSRCTLQTPEIKLQD